MLAVLRTLRTYRPTRVRVTVDGDVLDDRRVAGRGRRTRGTYAGGMMIAPDAALDDGLLDVCVVGDVSRPEFLRTFPSVYRGTHVRNPLVTIRRGTQVTHRVAPTRSTPLELWASGERRRAAPAAMTSVHAAIRVVT